MGTMIITYFMLLLMEVRKKRKLTKVDGKEARRKDYTCQVCFQKFANKSQATIHAKEHKGSQSRKPFRCRVCNRPFSTANHLKQHERVHTGVKPYKCPMCSRGFKQMSHLQQHVNRMHSKNMPFQCPFEGCGRGFNIFSQLKLHETKEHPQEVDGLYGCKWHDCSRTFANAKCLEIHIGNHKRENDTAASTAGSENVGVTTTPNFNGVSIPTFKKTETFSQLF